MQKFSTGFAAEFNALGIAAAVSSWIRQRPIRNLRWEQTSRVGSACPQAGKVIFVTMSGLEKLRVAAEGQRPSPALDQMVTALDAIRPTDRPAPSRESGFVR